MQGPAVRLHTKGVGSLALTVHELATNSLKFGALAVPNGHLAVIWTCLEVSAAAAHQLGRKRCDHCIGRATTPGLRPGGDRMHLALRAGRAHPFAFTPGGVALRDRDPAGSLRTGVEPSAHAAQGVAMMATSRARAPAARLAGARSRGRLLHRVRAVQRPACRRCRRPRAPRGTLRPAWLRFATSASTAACSISTARPDGFPDCDRAPVRATFRRSSRLATMRR